MTCCKHGQYIYISNYVTLNHLFFSVMVNVFFSAMVFLLAMLLLLKGTMSSACVSLIDHKL